VNTERISAADPAALERALAILRAGGLVAFPTDTVYGLGALAFDGAAVESIYLAKDRPVEKGIPILIADMDDLEKVAVDVPLMARRLALRFWPGPVTLILPKVRTLPQAVSTTDTVAVRIPDHPVARALLRRTGPLAVTSANLSGQGSPVNTEELIRQLNGRIPFVLDGGDTPGGIPSTLVDCLGAEPILLRAGPITREEIISALK
jgi:L-threonylcarbamoyladenylate synthase